MERGVLSREFKLEAVTLVRDRESAIAQVARDMDVHVNVLHNWRKDAAGDPLHAFLGNGQMKPERLEIERLRREVTKLIAERDILKKLLLTSSSTEGSGRRRGCARRSGSLKVTSMRG